MFTRSLTDKKGVTVCAGSKCGRGSKMRRVCVCVCVCLCWPAVVPASQRCCRQSIRLLSLTFTSNFTLNILIHPHVTTSSYMGLVYGLWKQTLFYVVVFLHFSLLYHLPRCIQRFVFIFYSKKILEFNILTSSPPLSLTSIDLLHPNDTDNVRRHANAVQNRVLSACARRSEWECFSVLFCFFLQMFPFNSDVCCKCPFGSVSVTCVCALAHVFVSASSCVF